MVGCLRAEDVPGGRELLCGSFADGAEVKRRFPSAMTNKKVFVLDAGVCLSGSSGGLCGCGFWFHPDFADGHQN